MKTIFTLKDTRSYKGSYFPVLFILLVALACIRIVALYLSNSNLYFDEAQYWLWSQEPAFGYFSKPPMLAWLIGMVTSACGSSSEFCVRLASPLVHTATALVIYSIAAYLYDTKTGFWSALAFATLPAISLSSGLISTDVPLLFFWALTLLCFVRFLDTPHWSWALGLGLFIGLGLMSKYAMLFFIVCAIIYFVMEDADRPILKNPLLLLVAGVAFLVFVPNIIWNMQNSFATVAHTADNANWGKQLFHPGKALEFFGAQFGVFGPILFGALIIIFLRDFKIPLDRSDRLLLYFSVPIILIITTQALLSRAHANWAATAYIAATILVIKTMITNHSWKAFKLSYGLHFIIALLLAIIFAIASPALFSVKGKAPFARLYGWQEIAIETERQFKNSGAVTILAESRDIAASLIYYLRNNPVKVTTWRDNNRPPRDHYQLTRAFNKLEKQPVLFVSRFERPKHILRKFSSIQPLGSYKVRTGRYEKIWFFLLEGYKSP